SISPYRTANMLISLLSDTTNQQAKYFLLNQGEYMLLYCIISSLLIGLATLYKVHQIDKSDVPFVINPKTGEYTKILSKDCPKHLKFALVLSFVPFINLFWLIF